MFKPIGVEFYDARSDRMMMLVTDGAWKGWLCFLHKSGDWVSLRIANENDLQRIEMAEVKP